MQLRGSSSRNEAAPGSCSRIIEAEPVPDGVTSGRPPVSVTLGKPGPRGQPGYDKQADARSRIMTQAVHIPYTVEQDEDGVWCAHAQLRPGVGANGEGDTREAAVADLREAAEG